MTKAEKLVIRLNMFRRTRLSNPTLAYEFAELIRDAHELPKFDHANEPLVEWIDNALEKRP